MVKLIVFDQDKTQAVTYEKLHFLIDELYQSIKKA